MFVPSQNLYIEILALSIMVLEGGAFGGRPRHAVEL